MASSLSEANVEFLISSKEMADRIDFSATVDRLQLEKVSRLSKDFSGNARE